jgi:hypothetical protein
LAVASQDVEGDAGDEVGLRVQAYVLFTFSLVRYLAVERFAGGGFAAVDGDV